MEPHLLEDIDGDLAEIEAIERKNRRVREFGRIRERMKTEKLSGARIARELGKSASQINSCLRGDYPFCNAYGFPKYLHDYLVGHKLAKESEITWMRRA